MDEDNVQQEHQQDQLQTDINATPVTELESETMQEEQTQESRNEPTSSKRALPEDEIHQEDNIMSSPPSIQSSTESSTQPLPSQENASQADSPVSSNKRRRISLPGKSILKSANQDDDTDLTGTQDKADDPALGNGSTKASDITETFSSTTEFLKRNRKSIGRRVSFAATARIRMFERDEKEDELPKTMSFLEGLNPKVALNTPFLFESGNNGGQQANNDNDTNDTNDTNGANDTNDSMASVHTGQSSQERAENTELSTGSSDSEKERSFEVNIYSGHSDSTGSSGAGTPFFLPSSDLDIGKTPFDDGDVDNGSSSEDDSNFFPDANLMKRSSGVGLYQEDQDSILGPRIDLAQAGDGRLSQRSENLDDGTQEYSMEFRFLKHRSSIPERLPTPPPQQYDGDQEFTNDFLDSQQYHADQIDSLSKGLPTSISGGDISNDHSDIGKPIPLVAHNDLSNNILSIGDDMDLSIAEALGKDDRSILDEDTDMDITAPIGIGIQQISQELPPTAFHHAEDHTALFSDLGTPMDITQPFGVGILEANDESVAAESAPGTSAFRGASLPSTPVRSTRDSIVLNNSNDKTVEHQTQGRTQKETGDYSQADHSQPEQATAPSTPPRRSSYPRRSLGTPGRFTPSVKARPNIFPEVLEKQLQTLESTIQTEPVFRASHVSPETSSLAKRIYRYSVGVSFRRASNFENKLEEDRDDTMDLTPLDKRRSSTQNFSNDIFNDNQSHADEDMTEVNGNDDQTEEIYRNDAAEAAPESHETAHDEGGDDDSFTELPPITLSKFLSLVGITFLDHLNASTRRRTIPHRTNEADPSTETYRSADLVKAMAVSMQELHSYREACRLLKQSIDTSRAFADEQEKKVGKKNPEYFREFRESNSDTKDFMKDRLKMIKVHSKLETNAAFSSWKTDVLKVEQETLEQHLVELKKDITNLGSIASTLVKEKAKVLPRRDELKRQLNQATERQRSYELCDKEQLASLAEAAEEQGAQIEHYESIKAKKAKELAEVRARVEQLSLAEKAAKARISEAEKTIQKHQYVRTEDLSRARDVLSIIQATHHWEPIRSSPSATNSLTTTLQRGDKPLEFVYDKTLRVSIDVAKIGKDPSAVQLSEFEEENMMDFDLSLVDRQRLTISALAPRKRRPVKEYLGLLHDYVAMVAAKYKAGTTISKILNDISQFWTKICLIQREVELIRAHHVVDLVAGSAENLKELELNGDKNSKLVAGSTTPLVVLDIRVRFTGPLMGARRSTRQKSQGDEEMEDVDGIEGHSNGRSKRSNGSSASVTEPVKFYLWFTFTLNDILNFPGASSFTWRLELVYGNISDEHVAQAIGPAAKKGGYDVLREACIKVNQLLKI
ncbi:hypothetical protein BGX26_000154 [Mortierella sp. AD094]|nr:hypothetical protein BGX26_000154 [Mortierella sp. AD094]